MTKNKGLSRECILGMPKLGAKWVPWQERVDDSEKSLSCSTAIEVESIWANVTIPLRYGSKSAVSYNWRTDEH